MSKHCDKCGDDGARSVLELIGCGTWLEAAVRYAEDGERWDPCLRERFEYNSRPETILAGAVIVLTKAVKSLRKEWVGGPR